MAQPLISYRGPEARALLGRIAEGFCDYLGTERQPVLLTASGTGAMEATLANLLSPGDPVLGIGGGQFAERFLGVAAAFGLGTASLDTPWGSAAAPSGSGPPSGRAPSRGRCSSPIPRPRPASCIRCPT